MQKLQHTNVLGLVDINFGKRLVLWLIGDQAYAMWIKKYLWHKVEALKTDKNKPIGVSIFKWHCMSRTKM